jgi:O-antigen/teichoic acid export membrane protein
MPQQELLQDETLAKKLITKGFWVYFFAFFTAPMGYLLRMVISNTVSVTEVGIFYSVLGLMGLLSTYNDLGLTEALQYFIPKHWIAGEKAKVRLSILVSFFMQMFTGILIFCLLYFGAEWLGTVHFHSPLAAQLLKILAFYFLGYNLLTLCSTIFTSFQDTFASGLVGFANSTMTLIFSIIFRATASLTTISFAYAWLIGVGTAIIVGLGILFGKYRKVFFLSTYELQPSNTLPLTTSSTSSSTSATSSTRTTLKQHFSYALWVFLVANVANLLGQVDQQVVVNVLGAEAAGFFSNFQALLMVFFVIVTPLLGLIFPITTELIAKKDTKKF